MASISEIPLGGDGYARPADPEDRLQRLETLGRLVSGVAHDFANLVTLITGYSEIVLNRLDPREPSRAELEEIRKAADRGARLTTQLLAFTRNDSVRPQLLNLNEVIYDIERMLHHIIGENVELRTDCAPELARVAADPGQIEQVIINLILNARDAMPMGGKILIRTVNAELSPDVADHEGMPPGSCVLLIVSDTGYGIGPTQMERIFEPFFTTKEKGRGTGLGLHTVQNIVRQSGGAVWVSSQIGQGATFTVCFPRAEAQPFAAPVPSAVKPNSGQETVLLVEDDDGVRDLLARILRDRGYTVMVACHGDDALSIFEKLGPKVDLLLTDLVMPGMGGMDLIKRLRSARPDLKVLCMSGYTEDVLVDSGSLSPGMPFLRKPLRPETLAAGVREALDSSALPFTSR